MYSTSSPESADSPSGSSGPGCEPVAFCESDPGCRAVLRRHWPGVPIHEDVRELGAVECDVVAGGFPCQPFSSAARGRNNAEDLWPEMLRVVRASQPAWVLAENVPGIGLEGVDRVCADLEDSDYGDGLPVRQRHDARPREKEVSTDNTAKHGTIEGPPGEVIHYGYSDTPMHFACGERRRDGMRWTRYWQHVQCPQCRARMALECL
jgi:site-specific DNA-cytosine methylase